MRASRFNKFEGHHFPAILRQELIALPRHLIGEFRGFSNRTWLSGKRAGCDDGKKQKLMSKCFQGRNSSPQCTRQRKHSVSV